LEAEFEKVLEKSVAFEYLFGVENFLEVPASKDFLSTSYPWNPKQPFIHGCFNWMIPNLYLGNVCFTKNPLKNGC